MVQHVLLLARRAAAARARRPVPALLWSLPERRPGRARRAWRRIVRSRRGDGWLVVDGGRVAGRRPRRCWLWHVPGLVRRRACDTSRSTRSSTSLPRASAACSGGRVDAPGRTVATGAAAVAVFVGALPGTALGAALTLRLADPWYPPYPSLRATSSWPACVMWAFAGMAYVVAAGVLFGVVAARASTARRPAWPPARRATSADAGGQAMIDGRSRWFDDRLGTSHFARSALNKVFPDNWSFMLGEIALYSLPRPRRDRHVPHVLLHPSAKDVVYHGSYGPLRGVHMSEAYRRPSASASTCAAGLVFRQMHHWAALVFVGADRRAPVPHLLHRRFRRPARDQLDRRRHPADPRHVQRLHRLLAARRPAVGHRPAHRATRSRWPSRSSARGPRSSCSAASSRRPTSRRGCSSSTCCSSRRSSPGCSAPTWRSCGARSTPSSPVRAAREDNIVGSRLWPTYALRSHRAVRRCRRR